MGLPLPKDTFSPKTVLPVLEILQVHYLTLKNAVFKPQNIPLCQGWISWKTEALIKKVKIHGPF